MRFNKESKSNEVANLNERIGIHYPVMNFIKPYKVVAKLVHNSNN